VQRRWLDRNRTDGVVGAVISSDLVNRQELDKFKSDSCGPIDELASRRDIANSEVVFSAQRKQRCENSSDLFLRRQIHSSATDEHGCDTD